MNNLDSLFETVNPQEGEQSGTQEVPAQQEFEQQEVEQSSENVEEPIKSPEELIDLPDEELKKYGIDDPKQWKSYQRLLHKKENEWQKRELAYQQMLQQIQAQFESKLNEFQNTLVEKINPPTPEEPLIPPVPPRADADGLIDPVEEARYAKALAEYNYKLLEKQKEEFQAMKSLYEQERKAKEEAEKVAQAKAHVINKLQQVGGLRPQQAMEALNMIIFKDEDEYAKAIVDLYKFRTGLVSVNKNNKERLNTPIPVGIEGGTTPSPVDETEVFMNGFGQSKTKEIFKKIL